MAEDEIARLTRERDAWKQRALYEEESRLTLVENLVRVLVEHGEKTGYFVWLKN